MLPAVFSRSHHTHKPMPDLKDYITAHEAAKVLGFHVISVRQMLRDKKIEGEKVGRTWLVNKQSLKRYQAITAGMEKHDPRRGKDN